MGKAKGLKAAQNIDKEMAIEAQNTIENRIRKEKEKQMFNSVESRRALRRNKINQYLTEANKQNPEARTENTKAFVDLVCRMICKEWAEITRDAQTLSRLTKKPINIKLKDIDKFVNGYFVHISNIIKYDNEIPNEKTSMIDLLLTGIKQQLPVLYSRFANLVLERTAIIEARETIKEA